MSAAVSSSRGNIRPAKEKHGKTTPQTQTKSEGPPQKVQATQEQIRLALLTNEANSIDDSVFKQKVKQVMDVTGITDQTEVAIALQDCGNDTEKAINMLLEGGNTGQGEWKEPGKKKKKTPAPSKTETTSNHVDEKTDEPEQTPEREKVPDKDRSENISRRGRRFDNRFDSRPPRLAARGRGRDRPNRDNNDNDAGENGFGTFGQERGFDSRGRGRGRGGRGGSRRGRGRSFNSQSSREVRDRPPQKFDKGFDKGPQIDTWTNETAANAEKENSAGPWGDGIEDWNDDSWQGNTQQSPSQTKLSESKVFEASAIQNREPDVTPMSDSTNTLGQRIDLGALLQKPTNESPESYLTQYNQQATETIKNTIGIGSAPRPSLSSQIGASSLSNHLSSGPLGGHQMGSSALSISLSVSSPSSDAVDALVSSLTQNSNLNTDAGTIDLTALTQNTTRDLTSLSQNRQNVQLDLNSLSQNRQSVPMSLSSQPDSISSTQQRPKPQRSKLPPPSKIPASAVEMPGHRNTNKVDVQFGNWEFETTSFGFGNGESVVSGLTSSANNSTQQSAMNNHLPKPSQQSESVITSSMMTPPPSAGTSVISGQESPRSNMFHNSPYTTPTKKDPNIHAQSQVSMSPPEPIPFPTDRKSSPMMAPQRPGSTPGLSQSTLSSSNPESTSLGSFSQGGYGAYQSQKVAMSSSAGLSGSAGLSNSSGLSNSASLSKSTGMPSSRGLSNTSDLTSATNRLSNSAGLQSKSDYTAQQQNSYQSQYPSGGNQYQSSQYSGQSQYHGSQNQYQNYGQSGSTFQSQQGSFSSGPSQQGSYSGSQNQAGNYQSNQNGPSSYQGSQSQTGNYSTSQSQTYSSNRGNAYGSSQNQSSSFPGTPNSHSLSGSQNPPGAYPGNQNTSTFNLTGNQNQGTSYNEMKSQTSSYNDPSSQSGSYSDRQGQSSSYSDRQNQSSSYSDRQSQSAGTFGSERSSQAGTYSERQNQSANFTGGSFSGSGQTGQSYNSANQSGQSSLYQAAVSNAYQGQNQPGSIYHQGGSSQTTSYQQQASTNYGRDSQSGSFSTSVSQSGSTYRDGSSSVTQSSFTQQSYGANADQSNLQSNLQSSALAANKLGETLSKMTVKDNVIDTRQSPSQFENSSSTSTANLTTTTNSPSLISAVSTSSASLSSATTTTVQSTSAKVSSTSGTTSKAPPNLPQGVPLIGHQYLMGQNVPYFGLQPPLYGYEDLQLLQQRLPAMNLQNLPNYNYDMTFGNVPTTLNTGRADQTNLSGNVPYSGTDNKLNRVEAQSPIPSTQHQSTQSHQQQQHFINLPYGYCYPAGTVLPGAPTAMGFQYPPMFSVPPVTNTAAPHAGTTANAQFQKQTYGSHSYGSNKGYDDLPQTSDFTKSNYMNQSQNKASGVSGLLNGSATTVTADLSGTGLTGVTGYGKTQPFATGSQAGSHIGAPTNPYGAQFIPLMTHQPPSQLHLQGLQQDTSTGSSARLHNQQTSTQAKAVTQKGYANTYWGAS